MNYSDSFEEMSEKYRAEDRSKLLIQQLKVSLDTKRSMRWYRRAFLRTITEPKGWDH